MEVAKFIALLIHGFNVWDKGQSSVGEFRSFFASEGHAYHILKYGHFGLWDTRRKNDNVARQVSEFISNSPYPVIVVGHSNGCAISYLATQYYGADPAHLIWVNPALKSDILLPRCCKIDIWHSPSDVPVKMAKLLPKAEFRPWGDMGAIGATNMSYNKEANFKNFNKERDFPVSSKGHSDVFKPELLSYFGPKIVETAFQRINEV